MLLFWRLLHEAGLSEEVNDLCMRMGIALAVWQNVEEQHYHVFLSFLDVPDDEVSSVAYFSVESFDARRKMVGRMATYALKTAEQHKQWGELDKLLKDHNDNRNKIAHYGIQHDLFKEPDSEFRIGPPSLRPSRSNQVSILLGRTSDKLGHNLSATVVDGFIRDFGKLARRLGRFKNSLPPRRGVASPYRMPPPLMPEVSPPPPLSKRRPRVSAIR
jgi:hypothetical protein